MSWTSWCSRRREAPTPSTSWGVVPRLAATAPSLISGRSHPVRLVLSFRYSERTEGKGPLALIAACAFQLGPSIPERTHACTLVYILRLCPWCARADAVATRVWRCAAGPIDADAPPEPPEKEVHGVAVADADRAEVFENPIYILGKSGFRDLLIHRVLMHWMAAALLCESVSKNVCTPTPAGSKNNLLLLRRESNSEPPNYFLRNLSTGDETQLTAFRHPQPQLAATKPSLITCACNAVLFDLRFLYILSFHVHVYHLCRYRYAYVYAWK
eukprot:SAG11_NODE_563_length_8516_cov_11.669122_4_plen_271_part_00